MALTLSSLALERIAASCDVLSTTAASSVTLRVQGLASPTSDGRYRCRARVEDGKGLACEVWLVCDKDYAPGTCLGGVGSFASAGDDEWGTSLRMCCVAGTLSLAHVEWSEGPPEPLDTLARVRRALLRSIDPTRSPERALLAGSVCGERSALREMGISDLFAACGVAHLVAVSGGHLMVVSELMGHVLEAAGMRPRRRTLLLVVASGVFVAACGAPVSAVRAWLMYVVTRGGSLVGRRSHSLSAVCIVALAMALTNPGVTGELGYVLSVASVCGLCALSGYARYAIDVLLGRRRLAWVRPPKVRRALFRMSDAARASLATSLVALVVTLPLTAEAFGQVSLVGPAANVVLGEVFAAYVALGVIAVAFTPLPHVQAIALHGCDALGGLMISFLRLLARLPMGQVVVDGGLCLHVFSCALLAAFLALWPELHRSRVLGFLGVLLAVALALVARWRWFAEPRICVLDVGQGDAILVQDGPHALLVDAGPDDAVAHALARNHVLCLDAVIITHLHDDHYGGISSLVGCVPCGEVLVANGAAAAADELLGDDLQVLCGQGAQELAYGDKIEVGCFELEVVWPQEEVDGSQNADSLELNVRYEGSAGTLSGLLTGDAESEQLQRLIDAKDVGDVDLLKVGHHGSAASITYDQALLIDAELAVASAGEGNSYGHPTQECKEALEGAGSLFLCTKDVGDVEVRPAVAGPRVRVQHVGSEPGN